MAAVGLGVVALASVIVVGAVAVKVAGRAGTTLEALFPPETVVLESAGRGRGHAGRRAPTRCAPARAERPAGPAGGAPVDADEETAAGRCGRGSCGRRLRATGPGEEPGAHGGRADDVAARVEIAAVMRRRFARDDPERAVREALQLYESGRLREITGDVVPLRAGLAILKGTLGEPVVRFLLTSDRPVTIAFGSPLMPGAGAEAWGDGYTLSIVVRDTYRHEPAVVLAPVLFHELMHQNGQAQLPEEVVNNVLDIRLTIELIRDEPTAFSRRSAGVDSLRFQTLIQLNTRVGTSLAVDRADASSVIPDFGGPPVLSFGAFLRSATPTRRARTSIRAWPMRPARAMPRWSRCCRVVAPDGGGARQDALRPLGGRRARRARRGGPV